MKAHAQGCMQMHTHTWTGNLQINNLLASKTCKAIHTHTHTRIRTYQMVLLNSIKPRLGCLDSLAPVTPPLQPGPSTPTPY